MRLALLSVVCAGGLCASAWAAPATSQLLPKAPIRFEPNHGQLSGAGADQILWSARGVNYSFAFTKDASLLAMGDRTLRMQLKGSNMAAKFAATDRYAAPTQYFTPALRGSVQAYRRLRREGVYPGIDLIYYGDGEHLEYDFEVAPGARADRIRMNFEGTDAIHVSDGGDLLLQLGAKTLTQRRPAVYQVTASGERENVAAEYRIEDGGDVSITLAKYDRTQPLVIDPVIVYSTYLAGDETDLGRFVAHDANGFVYVAGETFSHNGFPVTPDTAYGVITTGARDVWFMKLNLAASDPNNVIVYSTIFGGSDVDNLKGMAVDPAGKVYLTGSTLSTDFPTAAAFKTTNTGGLDAFVSVFDPTQSGTASLTYSTYLGGKSTDEAAGIAVAGGLVYVTGYTASTEFPLVNALRTAPAFRDAFVAEIDPAQSGAASLLVSTFLGGNVNDYGRAIAVDAAGAVYVAGQTFSADFPVTSNAFFSFYQSGGDLFLTKLDLFGGKILYSTYVGGTDLDDVKKIVVEPSGRVALLGYTLSKDYPVTQNAYQPFLGGAGSDLQSALIKAANAGFNPVSQGSGNSIMLPADGWSFYYQGLPGSIVLDGVTYGQLLANLALTSGQSLIDAATFVKGLSSVGLSGGGTRALNVVLTVLDLSRSGPQALVYSTFFGGSVGEVAYDLRRDAAGKYYFGGYTLSSDLPVSQNALNMVPQSGNGLDGFIAVLDPSAPPFNALVYSSYVTGLGAQTVYGIDIDSAGSIYVTGVSSSNIFPSGQAIHPTDPGNQDAFLFVLKLN